MSDQKPNLGGQSPAGSPVVNETRLEATNSLVGNASQVVNSPNAVVNQIHVTGVQPSPGLSRNDLFFWSLMALAVLVVSSKATINIGLPPMVGQLAAGGALAGIVWKFFERVEAVLTDATKFEIAVWLVGVNAGAQWEQYVSAYIRSICGDRKAPFRFLWISCATSLIAIILASGAISPWITSLQSSGSVLSILDWCWIYSLVFCALTCTSMVSIASVNKEVWVIGQTMKGMISLLLVQSLFFGGMILLGVCLMFVDSTLPILGLANSIWIVVNSFPLGAFLYCLFLSTIWLWIYVISAIVLKLVCRFDVVLQWFNSKADIEKKPLSAIGLVAGALVVCVYWGVAFGAYFLKHP